MHQWCTSNVSDFYCYVEMIQLPDCVSSLPTTVLFLALFCAVLYPNPRIHARAQPSPGTGQVVAGARGVPVGGVFCRGVLLGGERAASVRAL